MRRIALVAIVIALAAACSAGSNAGVGDPDNAGGQPSGQGRTAEASQGGGSQAQPGQFTDGSATISTPSGQATLDFSEGLYVSANNTVVANFADGDTTDPNTNALGVNGSAAGLSVTLFGPLQRQGVTTECTVSASKLEPSGLEGTFDCEGDVSGTFEAH